MPTETLHRFLAELKRRRVVRVVGAYLVAAFVLLQAVDLLVEPLRLPEWTMSLLVVLFGAGLVFAAVLSWAFDLTPDGIQRTVPAGDEGATSTEAPPPSSPPLPRRPLAAAIVVGLVIGLGAAAWLAFRSSEAASLDAGVVAVMPARVSGADASLGYLRSGIVDMLGAKLAGEVGPRAVDSRTTLHAASEAGGGERDLPLREARSVARTLGAGRVILSEVVGPADRFTLTATILDAASGAELARGRVVGGQSSLDSLTDALAAQLLAGETGLAGYRLPSLTSSLPAIHAYLRGRTLYRAGRHDQAAAAFQEALEQDSTFALAALGFIEARQWTTASSGFTRDALRLAWAYRHELSPRDRDYLEVYLGSDYGTASEVELTYRLGYRTAAEELTAIRTALTSSPDRPELHYRLGDLFLHYGYSLGIPDPLKKAEQALSRAVELDPVTGPVNHFLALKARSGDTAGVRRLVREYEERLPAGGRDGETWRELAWLASHALGEPTPNPPDSLGLRPDDYPVINGVLANLVFAGLDPTFAYDALLRYIDGVGAATAGSGPLFRQWTVGMAMGRSAEVQASTQSMRRTDPTMAEYMAIQEDLVRSDWSPTAREARDRLVTKVESRQTSSFWAACIAALWDTYGDPSGATEALERWYGERTPSDVPSWHGAAPCPLIQRGLAAAIVGDPGAPALLERADSVVREVPHTAPVVNPVYNLTLARAYQMIGDRDAALAAARRAEQPLNGGYFLSQKLLTEGRLAALTGDREGAIEAYRRYLALRPYPDPTERARDDRVRAELARLVGEGR